MFAIAWKEYRQIRLVALSLVGVVMAAYVLLPATPWAEGRFALIGIGVAFAATLVGALAFSEEKRGGTDVFLRTLPVGPVRRWAAGLAANLALTVATISLLLLAVDVVNILLFGGRPGSRAARLLGDPQTWLVLLALWSLAVFGSTVFENALLAMLFAFVTGVLVLNASVIAWIRLRAALDAFFVGPFGTGAEARSICVSIAVVCLTFSCVFEKVNVKRLGMLWRLPAACGVILIGIAAAIVTLIAPFALDLVCSGR